MSELEDLCRTVDRVCREALAQSASASAQAGKLRVVAAHAAALSTKTGGQGARAAAMQLSRAATALDRAAQLLRQTEAEGRNFIARQSSPARPAGGAAPWFGTIKNGVQAAAITVGVAGVGTLAPMQTPLVVSGLDPIGRSAVESSSKVLDALDAHAGARRQADQISEDIDIRSNPGTSRI